MTAPTITEVSENIHNIVDAMNKVGPMGLVVFVVAVGGLYFFVKALRQPKALSNQDELFKDIKYLIQKIFDSVEALAGILNNIVFNLERTAKKEDIARVEAKVDEVLEQLKQGEKKNETQSPN